MVRYIGYLLIALMTLALAGGVGLILIGGMAERLAVPGAVRLTAFDEVVRQGGRVQFLAYLEDMDYGRPIGGFILVVRPDDGPAGSLLTGTDGRGLAWTEPCLQPEAGLHDFTVAYPETHPRLDV